MKKAAGIVVATIAYLLFGVWCGSFSYKVAVSPLEHSYTTRLMLFPVSTILKDGWICADNEGKSCFLPRADAGEVNRTRGLLFVFDQKAETEARSSYIAMMAIMWLPKIIVNLVMFVSAFALSAILLFGMFVCGAGMILFTKLFHFVSNLVLF